MKIQSVRSAYAGFSDISDLAPPVSTHHRVRNFTRRSAVTFLIAPTSMPAITPTRFDATVTAPTTMSAISLSALPSRSTRHPPPCPQFHHLVWCLCNGTHHYVRNFSYIRQGEDCGVEVLKGSNWETSKTCCRCGDDTNANRVNRGLYVSPVPYGEDRNTGCVAQLSVHLFDRESGTFQTKEQHVA